MGMNDRVDDTKVNERDRQTGMIMRLGATSVVAQGSERLAKFTLKDRGYEWLLIAIKEEESGQEWVCFVSGDDPASCMRRFYGKANSEGLKWKKQEPWSG